MAIIQISKIQVRSGDLVDLPLLDEAEFGFANDEKRLFIGKTTPNENVEILTAYSSLSFSQIAGADGANLSLSLFEDGQVLAISDIGGNVNVVNRGGTKGGAINLGDVANLTILGGGSGQVLTTDGTGNLTWEPSGGPGGAPGGTNTMIQFNDSSSFGGNTGFTFDKITGNVAIPGNLAVSGAIALTATTLGALNFYDANGSPTDTSLYYNSVGDVLTLALNSNDQITIYNGNVTISDDLFVQGAISLSATACAAINFFDANSSATDTSIYYNSISDVLTIALNNVDKLTIGNTIITANDDLSVNGAISLVATACAAINFYDANSTATDSSIYYNSISDNFAIALNNVDKIEVFNANVTIHDDLFVEGAISLAATACAAINFFDANSTATDSSIYYNSISDNFAIALNNVDKIEVFNANITLHDDLIVEGAIALVATACAAINFYDAGGSATDTAIYYNSGSDVLTISLNGLDQIIVGNANTTVTNNFIANGANVNFTAATNVALGSNTTVKITGGLNGQYLRTDGSGGLSWATVTSGGAPGGSNTMIQFNDGGSSFGGNNFFTFDKTSGNVQIPGNTDIGGNLIIGNASSPTGAALNFRDANIANTDTSIYYTAVSEEGLYVAVNQAQTPGNGPKFGFQNNRNISYQDLTIVDGNLNSANVTTFNLANANATTINFGGAATTIEIGNSSGTTNINHNLDVDGNLNIDGTTLSTTSGTFNIANANTTTLNIGGAATTINMGAAGALFDFPGNLFIANAINFRDANGANTDTAIYYSSDYLGINLNSGLTPKVTIENTQVSITDNLVVKGGNIITDKTTFNLLNSTATTLNMGGAATTVNIGAAGSAGTLTISNDNTVLNGDLQVKGGDLTTNQTTFNLLNTTATTINFGGAATTVEIGSGSGTTNVNNNLDVDGDVNIDGGDLTVSTAAFNLANTNVTTLNIGGSATTVNLGNTSGTLTIRNASTVLNGDLAVNGGDITTIQTTANLFPANALTVNIGGGASNINIGNTGSLTSIAGNILLANAINFTDAAAPNTDSAIFYTAAGTEGFYITLNGSDRFLVSNSNATYSLNADLVISGAGYKIGYSAAPLGGTGGSVSQLTSRTTGVTINKATGNIVLVSAAGSASWNTFTVTNSVVGADDVIIVNQKSGTDKYQTFVTNVAAGSFQITFATTGGTTTESPVFNFSVIRGATS